MRRLAMGLGLVVLVACGGSSPTTKPIAAREALTRSPDLLELEAKPQVAAYFKDIARTSQVEAGQRGRQPVLFPVVRDGDVWAAPGFDARADFLAASDAGYPLQLSFGGRGSNWAEDRIDHLQGLSEREAAELVARALLALWNVRPTGSVQVDRALEAPYAAAYVDGILKLNPSFVYIAVTASAASTSSTVQ